MARKNAKLIMFFCLAGLAFLIICWSGVVYYSNRPIGNKERIIDIPEGTPLKKVAQLMKKNTIIKSPLFWEIYGRLSGLSGLIKAGEYLIPANISYKRLYLILASGNVIQRRVTFMAGMTVEKVLSILTDQPKMQNDLQDVRGKKLLEYLHIEGDHPEGLFYPDTYFYTAGSKSSEILIIAHEKLMKKLKTSWLKREKNLPYKDSYEALVMASLIEKETAVAKERQQIAGVFIRRLNKGMRLQSDPTVIYGMGSQFNGNLTRKDLRMKTPYNTYRIHGLPPTPISLVTEDDIEAALHPDTGDTLYFVAKGDGTHEFSETLAEHRKAVKKYQLIQRTKSQTIPAVNHSVLTE